MLGEKARTEDTARRSRNQMKRRAMYRRVGVRLNMEHFDSAKRLSCETGGSRLI